ncbi:uncharacterized protein LOC114291557 [Camellia sinensis]|uniref:uncharacterized protein LOC114291557 n=1 Tax=Camellia sinensis TaxID=4442 RepID=UPI00103677AF|nr:uncharacterized protein LOC114291557 [Camellia sinensis]
MEDELSALQKTSIWKLVPLPAGKNLVGCTWVYKVKAHYDGSLEHYKVRLVAKDDSTLYRELVGCLVYLTVTCPNLAYAVHVVSQFVFAPRSTYWAALVRILRYLRGTIFQDLLLFSTSSLDLVDYADSDWVGDVTNCKSTSGFCMFLGGSLISWKNKKQIVVARSTAKAEYRAMARAITELVWLRLLVAGAVFVAVAVATLAGTGVVTVAMVLLQWLWLVLVLVLCRSPRQSSILHFAYCSVSAF